MHSIQCTSGLVWLASMLDHACLLACPATVWQGKQASPMSAKGRKHGSLRISSDLGKAAQDFQADSR